MQMRGVVVALALAVLMVLAVVPVTLLVPHRSPDWMR
jgi:hypothetical protein